MATSQAYTINRSGTWPNEVYSVSVLPQVINPNLGFLPAENFFRFVHDPLLTTNYLNRYDYQNTSITTDGLGLSQINTANNSLLVWNVSAERRAFDVGRTFNSLSINTMPGTPVLGSNSYYNYLLYPNRLILKPNGIPTFDGTNWTLPTQTVILSQQSYFYNASTVDYNAANQHFAFLDSTPAVEAVPASSNFSISYNLCAARIRADYPLINFTTNNNPVYFTQILEDTPSTVDTCKIRPDSTFVSYAVNYYAANENNITSLYTLGASRRDITWNPFPTFKSGYIMNYDPTGSNPNLQAFQLVQIKTDGTPTPELSDIRYCVLSGVFDLSNTNFKYYAKNYQKADQTIINTVTGIPGTSIGLSYIADCPTMKFSLERWQDTAISVSTPLGVPVATNALPSTINWTTKYPPHYYSYKASLVGNSGNPYNDTGKNLETASLSFYVYTSVLSSAYTQSNYTTSVTLSTFITSNFNFVQYDLSTTGQNDYIKYVIVNTPSVVLSSLSCFYGQNLNNYYPILDSPWIPASQGKDFIITYPLVTHGELNFTLRPSLCTIAGYSDSINATPINLAKGQLPANIGQPIFISRTQEREDFIEVDSSFLNTASSWPTRDLRGSNITWDFYPSNSFVTINAVDLSGNYIQQISPRTSVAFGPTTWSVVVSGYGPQSTVVTLSSQKYNETTSLTSVSSLFNYFSEGKLLVGVSQPLNNFDYIRTISLTAAVPYKGRQYNLPSTTLINWTWIYDGSIDYENVPVSAYDVSGNFYNYANNLNSSTLSSISVKIVPPYATQNPAIHDVNIIASIDTNVGLLQGNYDLQVDDFPDPTIFNTDFAVYYNGYNSTKIADTRNSQTVVTRPNNATNIYNLSAYTDVIPYLPDGSIVWNVSGNLTYGGLNNALTVLNSGQSFVTLSALSATLPGWSYPHSIQATVLFYVLDIGEFYKPLEFNVIPEYFWLNDDNLTLSTPSNFTLASSPTAYANKVSNSQTFYLSSNKSYLNNYLYYTGSAQNVALNSVNSYYQLVDIPYQNEIFTKDGLLLSLTAFNDTFYPQNNGTYYTMPVGGNLVTLPFNIVASTTPATRNSTNPFELSPRAVPYSTINLAFTASLTSVNLDTQRVVTVYQNIFTNPAITPAIPYDGTVTYTLSSLNWSVNKDFPITNGYYDVFELLIGDSTIPLTVNGTKKTNLFLSASASVVSKIFPSTFDNVIYKGERNLWNSAIQNINAISGNTPINANSTTGQPEVYLSTTYTTTGTPVLLQYYTPFKSDTFGIIAYITDFGEPDSTTITAFDTPIFYNYNNSGTFYISYSALYNDGSVETFQHPNPLIISPAWEVYDPNALRFNFETILALPYTLDQVSIQPNEWGDADIFNNAITKLQDNLDYLIGNVQTLDTNSPTVYFGWLGSNQSNLADGIRWYTKDYGSDYHLTPSLASLSGMTYFNNIVDAVETNDHIFVLDGTKFRAFSADYTATEIPLAGVSDLKDTFLSPISIEADETGTIAFVADPLKNKVYRFDLELYTNTPTLNYTLNVGGLGTANDTNKFNSPSELAYANGDLYILDYNNYCVKEYNIDLNWIFTYTTDEFQTDTPTNITVHPLYNFIYVLTKSKKIYVFDHLNSEYFASFPLPEVVTGFKNPIIKIILDEHGDFLYVVTKTTVYKYSSSGYFITSLSLPANVSYVNAKKSHNRSLLFFTQNAITKVQDVLTIHRIGEGLNTKYWTKDQLTIGRDEFASEMNYNRCLVRIAQNMKSFRDSMNSKLVLATEQTNTGVVTYFAVVPISVADRPVFDALIENESVFVGSNELHTPQVINKMIELLYSAVYSMKTFLDITNFNVQNNTNNNGNCTNQFCWSWKGMACYNLSLPAIRICNVNPITYTELEANFPVSYAPSKTWAAATSDCCNKVTPPV